MELNDIERLIRRSRIFVATVIGVTVAAYLLWFEVNHDLKLSTSTGDWGAFGDFIGGILNPIVAYSAFYVLTVSVILQKNEFTKLGHAQEKAYESQLFQQGLAKEQLKQTIIDGHKQTLLGLLEQQMNIKQKELDKLRTSSDDECRNINMQANMGMYSSVDREYKLSKIEINIRKSEVVISNLNKLSIDIAVKHYSSLNTLSEDFMAEFNKTIN